MTLLDPAVADFVRDRWGRPLIVPPDGGKPKPYTRSSSAAKTIEDTYNLELWARRNVVFGMAHDASLVARALALAGTPATWDDAQRQEANRIHEAAAAAAQAHRGADIGTAVHLMSQRVDLGESFDAGPYEGDLNAYMGALVDAGLSTHPEWVECRIVCDELEMAGTADRIVTTADGRHLIADLKTGSSVAYGGLGWAAQLASYAHGHLYDVAAGERLDTPPLDRTVGVIIHLPAGQGTCTLYEIDLVAGYRAAQLANEIRAVRQASRRWISPLTTGAAVPPAAPVVPVAASNVVDITHIPDRRARLRERYQALNPARAAAFRARNIPRDDLDAVEAALDELTRPRPVDAERLSSPDALDLARRRDLLNAAQPDGWLQVNLILAAALQAGTSLSFRFEPHQRNLHVCRALLAMVEHGWDEDTFRSLCACALDDTACEQPGVALADVLAAMTTDEAARLDELTAAL